MKNTLYTVQAVSKELGLSLPTVRKLINAGKLRALNVNGRRRVRRCHLDDFLDQAERPAVQS